MTNNVHPHDGHHRAVITLEISSVADLASAQQRMRVISVSRIHMHHLGRCDGADVQGCNRQLGLQKGQKDQLRTISFPIRWYAPADQTNQTTREETSTSIQQPPPAYVRLLNALRIGKNRLVMREWRQGACWWNLNMNNDLHCIDDVELKGPRSIVRGSASNAINSPSCESKATQTTLSMARAEVAGYRLALYAMDCYHDCQLSTKGMNSGNKSKDVALSETAIFMPEVLYFSHDDDDAPPPPNLDVSINSLDEISNGCGDKCKDDQLNVPWALLSYHENGTNDDDNEILHQKLYAIVDCESTCCIMDFDDKTIHQSEALGRERIPCHHFPTTMVKIRHEFGFDEPHPRHGRVPLGECVEYAQMIVRDVIMPVQTSFFRMWAERRGGADLRLLRASKHNTRMINNHLLSVGWGTGRSNDEAKPFQYHDMIAVYRHALHRISAAHESPGGNCTKDERVIFSIRMLDKCADALNSEWEDHGGRPPPLPPVLCHMDLQPQNLAFCHTDQFECNGNSSNVSSVRRNGAGSQDHTHNIKNCSVASVMDWEEACYADPRFELLLVCRKVLANREQSEILWQSYSNRVQQLGSLISSQSKESMHWEVGPLEPWLKLETVHSLWTLLLQAVDLLGGGRSPWETKPDLWGKIERERQRLVQMGWLFCGDVE